MAGYAQRLYIPPVERLALIDLAQRRGQTENQVLASAIREAVRRECAKRTKPVQACTADKNK